METTGLSLKLTVDPKCNKVLFAQADKEFVDFLFGLLSLPLGTVTRLLSKHDMAGSLGKLYKSVANLENIYMCPHFNKDTLLKPESLFGVKIPRLLINEESTKAKRMYMCESYHRYVTDDPRALCPRCKCTMSTEVPYVAPPSANANDGSCGGGGGGGGGGYLLNPELPYMILDNLEVKKPFAMDPTPVIHMILQHRNMFEKGCTYEDMVVHIGMDEGLKLLKASLESTTVLTDVFLGKKEVETSIGKKEVEKYQCASTANDDMELGWDFC